MKDKWVEKNDYTLVCPRCNMEFQTLEASNFDEFGNHLDDWNELKEIKYWQPLPKSPIEEQEETK